MMGTPFTVQKIEIVQAGQVGSSFHGVRSIPRRVCGSY
jgi:hypothetical protein